MINKKCLFLSVFVLNVYSNQFVSGNAFREISQHQFFNKNHPFSSEKVNTGDIVFVQTDVLEVFFKKHHGKINNQYILVTHDTDFSSPGRFAHYLKDPKIFMWFGQNPNVVRNPKFIPIPMGIRNTDRPCFYNKNMDKVFNESHEKRYLVYLNIATRTNPAAREPVVKSFQTKSFCFKQTKVNHEEFLRNIKKSKFVISPRGAGLDCYRTWESISLGSIPIVKTSPLDPIFEDLPVLIVKEWHQITEQFLNQKYEEFKNSNFNYEKIFFDYWKDLILKHQDMCRKQ